MTRFWLNVGALALLAVGFPAALQVAIWTHEWWAGMAVLLVDVVAALYLATSPASRRAGGGRTP